MTEKDRKKIFDEVYRDFFGLGDADPYELNALRKGIEVPDLIGDVNLEMPEKTSVQNTMTQEAKTEEQIKEEIDKFQADINKRIDDLYIDDKSKSLLKQIVEYMRKYKEGIEKQYISFNMCIYSDNTEVVDGVTGIMYDASLKFSYIKPGTQFELSFYNVETAEQIEKAFEGANSLIIKDFDGFSTLQDMVKEKVLFKLADITKENNNQVLTILVSNTKEVLEGVLEKRPELKDEFMDFEIVGIKPDVQDAYQELVNKLEPNMELTDDFKVKLLDYVSNTYTTTTQSFKDYRDKVYEKIIFTKEIPTYEKEKTLDEIFAELNDLVGLKKVKEVLNDLVSLMEFKQNQNADDLKVKNVNLHMVFLGNPGTGKTTVARIVAEILYNLKYIKQNKLVEVSSKDLVGEYVGQTAPKTMKVVEKALGGVMFVDEAYSLASGGPGQNSSYNEEAIATLIQAMENYRDDLVVIFAGYTREMQNFLNANSGIVSRIGYTLEFEDYTTDELIQIFDGFFKKAGFVVSDEANDVARKIIDEYRDSPNFGNARFARNLYEKSVIKHASNTRGKKQRKVLKTITAQDISSENLLK
jgi:SpoVK/Ycf46/Vps4 family AAA+-type ATPase